MKASAYVAVARNRGRGRVPSSIDYVVVPRAVAQAVADARRPVADRAGRCRNRRPCPTTLPDFTLGDLDGTPRSIRSWPGKSMIVNFWATWCAPCRREIPLLRELQKQHGAEGFQIVGVAVDFREDVVKYAQEIGIDYPVLIGEQDGLDAVNKFGQGSHRLPVHGVHRQSAADRAVPPRRDPQEQADVLLGVVRDVNSGELTPEAARIVAAKQLAANAPDPAAG